MKSLIAFALVCLAAIAPAAAAAPRLHGVVLGLDAARGDAVVRHDAFGAMPAMTMTFRIQPRALLGTLQPGTTIDATVDTSTDPWTLRDLRVADTQRLTTGYVKPDVTPLRLGDVVPDVPMLDQRGRPFRLSHLRGSDVILSFIYTRCQDPHMCPLISAKYNALQHKRGTRALHLVEVTLDPSYDRPPVLARYGAMFGADPRVWTLAVGDAKPTLDFAARFGIVAIPDPAVGIAHSENTVEIDPDGRIAAMHPDPTWDPDALLAEIDTRHHLASEPFARVDLWLSQTAIALVGPAAEPLGGIGDLTVLIALIGALGYLGARVARGIFAKSA